MLTTLHIKNIGIIEDLSIDLNKGLNVLTGETGAGKTLIIDSIQIISGGRFSKDMIRKGETGSFVELCIYDPKSEISINDTIIVSREININGKNLCKINGRMVTVNELKEFMEKYIEIHGQNDNQDLLNSKLHLEYLDGYIGEKIEKLKNPYQKLFERYQELNHELKENYGDEKERQRKLDLLGYQLKEIEQADLKEGEEEELEEKRNKIVNVEKINISLQETEGLIGENAIEAISSSIRSLEKIESLDEKYEKASSNLKSIYYELQEIERDITNFKDDVYFDEEERIETEDRIQLIRDLKRKYGNSIEEILSYKESIKKEIDEIENLEKYNEIKRKELKEVEEEMRDLCNKMNELRCKFSKKLSEEINQELVDLEMSNAKISVHVDRQDSEFTKTGIDKAQFFIRTNLGEDEKELNKIASGGEMSRTMLAIKKVLADTDKIPVLIFDEIDTGISGTAANSVAQKLKDIAQKHQVMCISHLANIAAIADYNYYISKKVVEERTKTQIKLLQEKEVLKEIARISSGEINEITLKYAEELRNKKAS